MTISIERIKRATDDRETAFARREWEGPRELPNANRRTECLATVRGASTGLAGIIITSIIVVTVAATLGGIAGAAISSQMHTINAALASAGF